MKEKLENVEEEWHEVEEERDEVNYVKWEKEGTAVVGTLKEVFRGKQCKFAKVDTGDALLTMFSVPSLLDGKLTGHEGQKVRIVYVGKVKFNSGRSGKDFKVYTADGKSAKPAAQAGKQVGKPERSQRPAATEQAKVPPGPVGENHDEPGSFV